ncbi:ABC transporter ATP-binding protein [bacterium]|nr:ABC transporter ATP-binding protein [bacterium]
MTYVDLQQVSVRFRKYTGYSTGLKEAVMRFLSRPDWLKNNPPEKKTFWGLRGVDLKLQEGDRLGVIGHNGAGKSTLLKVVSRIYRPTEGSIRVTGRIAPLIEIGAGFNPELTGRENAFLNGAILGIPRKTIQQRIDSIIEFSELSEFFDMPVKYYSTGMSLRLAFTLATEVTPDILILDELYAGGDAAFVTKANTRLEKFVDQSKVLILVAHNMDYIHQFCNRTIVLEKGRILAEGPPKEIVKRYLDYAQGDSAAFGVRT